MTEANQMIANKEIEKKEEDTKVTLNLSYDTSMVKIRNKIFPVIGMMIGLLTYFAWILTIFFLITGSLFVRTTLILLLIYQFFFAKKSEYYRRFLKYMKPWEVFNSYTVKIEEPLKNNHCLFSFHPHGALGFGVSMSGAFNEILYDSIFCGSRAIINLPISGIIARWMGVQGVNHQNFKEIMKKGRNIVFIPGGFEEATITNYTKDRVFIKERKGFIKYALEYGYRIYPCYTFNENKIFFTITWFEQFRLFLNKLKIPGVIFFSKYLIFPNTDIDLVTVVGKPIDIPMIAKPSVEDIDKYHQIYLEELVNLYNRYKHLYESSEELEIL